LRFTVEAAGGSCKQFLLDLDYPTVMNSTNHTEAPASPRSLKEVMDL